MKSVTAETSSRTHIDPSLTWSEDRPSDARVSLLSAPGAGAAPQVIDFFSGCGGTSAGLERSGCIPLAAVDNDADAARTYRANFPGCRFFEQDVRELEVTAFDELIDPARPVLLAACAPCQPYSTMRQSKAPRSDRTLLLQLLPFIDHLRPDVVMIENVPGMQRVPGGSTWNRFVKHLERRGYAHDWKVVDVRAYGVPQRRNRLVLLASRRGPVAIPEPTHGPTCDQAYATVRDWIGHLPPIEAGQIHDDDPIHRARSLGALNLQRIRAIGEGGSRSEWHEDLWLECHKGVRGHQDTYGRMEYDSVAPVLTTKCTDITGGRYGHPTQDRPISVREAALLQTFPADFAFTGSINAMTRQVGNAVPVLFAEVMGRQSVTHLRLLEGR